MKLGNGLTAKLYEGLMSSVFDDDGEVIFQGRAETFDQTLLKSFYTKGEQTYDFIASCAKQSIPEVNPSLCNRFQVNLSSFKVSCNLPLHRRNPFDEKY